MARPGLDKVATVAGSAVVYCSPECMRKEEEGRVSAIRWVRMPLEHRNPVIDAALELKCCDHCGFELRGIVRDRLARQKGAER